RLASALGSAFGPGSVFLDVQSIRPGARFSDDIDAAGASANVLLALIGARWLSAADEGGRRRLDDPDDFVRREIAAALERGVRVEVRLVTLTGAPGTGKTRLAIEVGTRADRDLERAAFFVDLAQTHDPAIVLSLIAAAVGVRDTGQAPLLDLLSDELRTRPVL